MFSAADLLALRIAKARGLHAKPGTTPDPEELRRAFEAYDSIVADALQIIRLREPESDEFCRRAENLRVYTRNLLARI